MCLMVCAIRATDARITRAHLSIIMGNGPIGLRFINRKTYGR